MEEKARTGNRSYLFGIGILIALILTTMFFVLSAITAHPAHAHDWKRPDLDGWYSGLQATGKGVLASGASCCSKSDCHTTEAEIRNGEWWARLGVPRQGDEWELGPWAKVPPEIIVRGPNGNPVPNQAGEAVICHSRTMIGNQIVPQSPIFCFVPPNET